MPALRFTALAVGAPQTVAAERRDARIKPISIMIDNTNGAADRTITLRDSFTPDVSNGVPVPVATTLDRLTFTVVMTGCVTIPEESLREYLFFGDLICYANAVDANCLISLAYEFV